MTNCTGPCLEHCYLNSTNNQVYLYLLVGIIIGFLFSTVIKTKFLNIENKKTNEQ